MNNTRRKIVLAAISAFKKYGLEKTKISDIVKKAGIAQGTFYLYFPHKLAIMPDIAQEMIHKILQKIISTSDENAPLPLQIKNIMEAFFETIHKYRQISAFLYTGFTQSEDMKKWGPLYEPLSNWLTDFLTKNSNRIRSGINPASTALILITCFEESAERIFLFNQLTNENIQAEKTELLNFILHALGIREA